MKKVLILSCNTGQGHNSCAQALKDYCDKEKRSCEIQDALIFISKQISSLISWGHSFIYRHLPFLFRLGYRYSEKHSAMFQKDSLIHKILISGSEHLHQYLINESFDTVICTHVFAAIMITDVIKRYPISIKTAFIATDYTCYPGLDACNMQKYFIADKTFIDDFVSTGISREHMVVSGIPVRRSFCRKIERADAKRLLNISAKNKHLLVMCGSMGCGPIAKMMKQIAKEMTEDMEVSVICGTNKRLFKRLNRRYKQSPYIHIIGYTNQMPLYMDSANLYITKPGGISVTEAAVKYLPMAFINAVAGCEQYNMNFFLNMGAAITADTPKKLASKSMELLRSPTEIHDMEKCLREHKPPNGAEYIYKELQ